MSYDTLADQSRVWIYQSSRPFSEEEVTQLRPAIQRFAAQWISHSNQLKAFGDVYHNQFVVLMVDESAAGASGCSIDSSVRFIKHIEGTFLVDLFDRLTFTYKDGEKVKAAHKDQFAQLYREGKIDGNTLVFDNLVKTKKEFEDGWIKPLDNSWHKRMV